MKLHSNPILFISFFVFGFSCDPIGTKKAVAPVANTNYGYNIVVAFDLSNRILKSTKFSDPEILYLITDNLKTVFRKSVDVGNTGKFYVTTINDEDFKDLNYSDSVFRIDLTRFKTNAVSRSDYLYHNDAGANSLKHDVGVLTATFSDFYSKLKNKNQLPADMWYFLQDKLVPPVIDTSSITYTREGSLITNKLKNYIIVVTDGYIEAGRYKGSENMKEGNKYRYLSGSLVDDFRKRYNNSTIKDFKEFFTTEKYGVIPVKNDLLKDCKLLVLELDDRSVINGVTTKTPTDLEILKLFWNDWLTKSGLQASNIILKEKLTNKQNLSEVVKSFLEIK